MNLNVYRFSACLALLIGLRHASAQGTLFTYQGQLIDNGQPANGTNYGMVFYIYDAPVNGNLLGNEGIVSVAVSNGLFTVPLDFGNVFDGTPHWLQISVQKNGGAFTLLTPRQQLTPTPYAVFANTASNLVGTLPLTQLSAAVLTNNQGSVNLGGTFSGDGSGLTNVHASINGIVEFTASGTFTVPAGVSQILIELWGGGGGGGSGSTNFEAPPALAYGGGGGAGGYTRAVIPVISGAGYTIRVGSAGAGGQDGQGGSAAQASAILDASSNILAQAGGGTGGGPGLQIPFFPYVQPGGGGSPGSGTSGTNSIGRTGGGGGAATTNSPGAGGVAPAGSIQTSGGAGGGGGSYFSAAGKPGYILITY